MIYVVPSLKAKEKLQSEGKAWAESQGFTYVPRGKRTIQDLMDEYGEDFLVYSSRGPQIDRPEGSHFFSLNMAELRIRNLRKGQRDHLLEALMGRGSSKPPITVLDCTRLWRRCGCRFFWLACRVTLRCPGGVTPAGSGHIVGLFPFCSQERRRHGGTATDFSAPWRLSRLPIIRRRTRVRRPLFRSHVPAACRGELPVPARPGHYGTRRSDAGPD